ncbi:baseplate J/gp47 family protein [Denitratisoma sp. agr-D3]
MSFNRPSLAELIAQKLADIEARLPGASAQARRKNLNVLGTVVAGGEHGIYGALEQLWKRLLPSTCADEDVPEHAAIWLTEPRIAASYASGSVEVSGTNGAVVDADTALQRSDGTQYLVDNAATVAGGIVSLSVTAVDPGEAGNADAGTVLYFVSPVSGLSSSGVATGDGLTGGADIESFPAERTRLLARLRNPPQGGCGPDYVGWAKEVAGVTRAWVYPKELGRGTVTLRFVRDNDDSPIPTVSEVAAVQAYIDARRPPGGEFYALAPIPDAVVYQIHLSPDTPAVRSAVEAELIDLHAREATPGGNYYDPDAHVFKTGGVLLLSHMRAAISLAAGEEDSELVYPAANIVSATGHMPVFGGVVWV